MEPVVLTAHQAGRHGRLVAWRAPRSARCAVAAALLAGLAGATLACSQPWVALQPGVERSRWHENSAAGHALLHEMGDLATLGLAVGGHCANAAWTLRLGQAHGQRDYQGLSSNAQPITTHSGIHRQTLEIEGLWPLGPSLPTAQARWTGGARVAWRRLARDLADAGRVRGYPERFAESEVALGLQRQLADHAAAMQLNATLWLGSGPRGRLHLQLPNADAAVLRLGRSAWLEAALQARGPLPALASAASTGSATAAETTAGWWWTASLVWRHARWAAGPAQAITRNGIVVAGAAQPATRENTLGVQAGLRRSF